MYIAWGEEFIQFYNDGYRPILGSTKHPAAMGLSTKITFAEIWNIIGPMFEGVMKGNAVGFTDFLLPLDRHGFTEECYFIFSYSPIKQENGLAGGVLVTVTETTERLLGERRLKTLRELGDRASKSKNITDASDCILQAIDVNKHDIPFSIFYLYDPVENTYKLAGSTGIVADKTTMPQADLIAYTATKSPLIEIPISNIFNTITFKNDSPWPEKPHYCCSTIVTRQDQNPFGILVLGISSRLRYDHHYQNFYKLLTDQAVTALSNANAFEEERKRAEALAELDRAKTAFFSNISHEFRTPLTLMLGPLEEMLHTRASLDNRQFQNAEVAHRNAIRLLRLVNTLLDFSRIESGRIQAAFRPVDLAAFTTDLASNFRSIIEKAGLKLTIQCSEITQKVYVDYGMWEKIVLNLLSNAFKYTLKGSIDVILEQNNKDVVLKVKDTGVGIPEHEIPHMFERFHRIANSAGRSHEGTGIGLSLVCELVKLHKGTISVESKFGEGSTFTVSLPVGYSHLPADKVMHEEDKLYSSLVTESYLKEATSISFQEIYYNTDIPKQYEEKGKKDSRILVVDDNTDMVDYLKRVLDSHYIIFTAPNGKVALEKVTEIVPDLVISDIMMPVMDGVELLKKLKEKPSTANIPVMLLSARAGEESRIEGYDLGADDYLVKPFSVRELLARVRAQIQIARTRSHLSSLLKQVFKQTPAAITIIKKEDYLVEFANDLYLQIVDKGPEFIGKPVFDSLPELQNQGIRELLDTVMATGNPHIGKELEIHLNRQGKKDKTYFNFIYHPLREQDGTTSGVIVVCFEVTDLVLARMRAEESEMLMEEKVKKRTAELESKNDQLQQQKDFIETILDSSIDIISVFDKDLNYVMVNKKFEEVYDIRKEDVLGRHPLQIWPNLKNSKFYTLINDVLDGSGNQTTNYVSVLTGRHYELYAVPIKHHNEMHAILAVAHDNTDIVEAAKRLEEKNNELQKVNEELEQFAYVASHDLQEPLRKIRIFSSILEKNLPLDIQSKNYFDKIHSSSDRMSRLIKDVLNYSKLSSQLINIEDVDLNEVIESVVSDFELMIEEKNVKIVYANCPVIKGIKLQIHQLFSNLISNAIKFCDKDPIIEITCVIRTGEDCRKYQQAIEHSSYVEVAFKDNGIGFDPQFTDQIFTIFQRLNEKQTSGTGIGLALCKKIAENHKGFIRVESTRSVGSTFFVYLPYN